MRTLLIGDMKQIDELYRWLEVAEECFDVERIFSETELTSGFYVCPIEPIDNLYELESGYEAIFICSTQYRVIIDILLKLGVAEENIYLANQVCKFLTKKGIMDYYEYQIHNIYQKKWLAENIQVGEFTYGIPCIRDWGGGVNLSVGKFCSIASNVTIMLGGEHRIDWCTTYPFNALMNEFSYIKGHPASKGDILIGNDVWLASDCKILSGVRIGDGCVVAANAVVTKDVEPYSVVAGNPAKIVKKRFDKEIIEKLEEIQWWNWEKEYIYDAIPLLQSDSMQQLIEYYETVVKPQTVFGENL